MAMQTFPERFRARVFGMLAWAFGHRRSVAAAAAALVLAAAGIGLWWWQAERREGSAGRALAEVNLAFRQQYPAGFYLSTAEGTDPKPGALIQRYVEVADRFAGTRAGAEARLRAAHLEYSAALFDAAIRSYERYLAIRRAPFRATAFLGKGYALEAKGDLAGAVEAFGHAAEAAGNDPIAAEAYLDQGQVLEALKKRGEALRVYGLVAERFPQSSWAVRAAERAAALQ